MFQLGTRLTYDDGSGKEILGVLIWESLTSEIGNSLLPYSMTPAAISEGVGD